MKIDRAEVEELLAACAPGGDTLPFLKATNNLTRRKLRALCRLALEVMDAPEATIEWQRDVGMVLGSCRLSSDLVGQRVRLVRVGEGWMDKQATKRDVIYWALLVIVALAQSRVQAIGTLVLALAVLWWPAAKATPNA